MEGVDSAVPRRGRAEGSKTTQFKPGHPGRKGANGHKAGAPLLLRDMRQVYQQDESKDRTPGQKALRQLLQDNPKEFIARLTELERAYASNPSNDAAQDEDGEPIVDMGTERVLELGRRLMAEWGAEDERQSLASFSLSELQTEIAGRDFPTK